MNYFDYAKILKVNNPYRSWLIYKTIYESSLVNYAGTIYGAGANDALDNTFQILLLNYDEARGNLEHYATATLGRVDLSKGRREVPATELQGLMSDVKAFSEDYGNPVATVISKMEERHEAKNIANCEKELFPYLLVDYKFFKTRKKSDKLLDYSVFYSKYSTSIFIQAMKNLMSTYSKGIEALYSCRNLVTFKVPNRQRYEKFLDSSITYVGESNGIVIYNKTKFPKKVYKVDLRLIVKDLIRRYYISDEAKLSVVLGEDITGYCSLSGRLTSNIAELETFLEEEIVQAILSRLPLSKVLYKSKGKLILVSTKDLPENFEVEVLGDTLNYDIIEVPSKLV